MHEMSIVQALIEQVGSEVEKSGQRGRVVGLDLVVGRLSGVHADSVRFAFELLAPGTMLDGAALHIAEPLATSHCQICGVDTPVEELVMRCLACGSEQITITGGQDLLLQTIELEDEETP